jgi:hypothetical protein
VLLLKAVHSLFGYASSACPQQPLSPEPGHHAGPIAFLKGKGWNVESGWLPTEKNFRDVLRLPSRCSHRNIPRKIQECETVLCSYSSNGGEQKLKPTVEAFGSDVATERGG